MSSLQTGIKPWCRAGIFGCMMLAAWWLQGCATVSQQHLQEAADSQLTVPVIKVKAKKALDAGQFVEAAHWYEMAAQRSDDEELAREATISAYDHAQWRAAIRSAQRWLQINTTSQDAHQLAALAAIRVWDIDTAVDHLQSLLESAYISPGSGFLQLLPKLQEADASASLAAIKKIVTKYDDVAEAHYVIAKLASQTANQALMLQEAKRASELAPYWPLAGITYARAQLAGGQVEQALLTVRTSYDNDKTVATGAEYADLLIEAGKVEEALQLLKELEKMPGEVGPALLLLAQLELQTGDYQSGFDHYSRLINSGAYTSEAMYGMAQISERAGAIDNARQLYARVQEGEYSTISQIRLAQLVRQQDGIDAALALLKQYGDGNPDKFMDMLRARAELLIASGDNKNAMALYDHSIATYPDETSLKLARAFLLVKLGNVDEAIQVMQKLAVERPDDPIVLNALGYTIVDRGRDVRQGQNYVQRALQYSPDSGAVLDSMGWAEFKLGHPAVALDYLQRAVKRTVDADLDFHLGEVLWSMKRYDDAVLAWQIGLKHAPKHDQILQRLQMAEKQGKGSSNKGATAPAK
ncbi:MAG TPA: tetratricopeptide repeat protein [Steroidobacteraceae bacterium]|nr:tetratricopeptide repeat protein [Steroidobacteraceae bacterium]